MLASAGGQPDPPCHQGAQHVSVGKQRNVAIGTPRSRNHPIHPRTHLLWHLTARKISQPGAISWICFGVSPSYLP